MRDDSVDVFTHVADQEGSSSMPDGEGSKSSTHVHEIRWRVTPHRPCGSGSGLWLQCRILQDEDDFVETFRRGHPSFLITSEWLSQFINRHDTINGDARNRSSDGRPVSFGLLDLGHLRTLCILVTHWIGEPQLHPFIHLTDVTTPLLGRREFLMQQDDSRRLCCQTSCGVTSLCMNNKIYGNQLFSQTLCNLSLSYS